MIIDKFNNSKWKLKEYNIPVKGDYYFDFDDTTGQGVVKQCTENWTNTSVPILIFKKSRHSRFLRKISIYSDFTTWALPIFFGYGDISKTTKTFILVILCFGLTIEWEVSGFKEVEGCKKNNKKNC